MYIIDLKKYAIRTDTHTGKKFGTDTAPGGRAIAFTGGELCDYAFG